MRYSVDAALVQKRAKCIGSSYDKSDCRLIFERAMNSIQADKPNKNDIIKFFNECDSPSNANTYYRECLSMIDSLDDDRLVKSLKEKYIDSIVPYVENMYSIEKEADYVNEAGFSNTLKTVANQYKICDRILDNHAKISKRFNIEHFVESSRNKSLDRIILPCCNMIDTYDLKPHAKMNVALEEVSYLLQKQNIKYKKEDLVKYVTEFFLNSTPNTSVDMMNKYRMVLSENSMISDNDLYKVFYFTEMEDDSSSDIVKALNSYTTEENKTIEDFCNIIDTAFGGMDKDDLIDNLSAILSYIRDYMLTDRDAIDCITASINKSMDTIEGDMHDDTWKYSREDLDSLIRTYNNEIEWINNEVATNPDKDIDSMLISLKDAYMNAVGRLTQLTNMVYPTYDINCMVAPQETITTESMTLHEFQSTKFSGLMKFAKCAESIIDDTHSKFYNSIQGKLARREDYCGITQSTIQNSRTCYGTVDICIAEFDIINEGEFYQVQDALTDLCKYINDNCSHSDTASCYYKVLPQTVEIHVADSSEEINAEFEHPEDDIEDTAVCQDGECEVEFSTQDKEEIIKLSKEVDAIDSIDDKDRFANLPNEVYEAANKIDKDQFDIIMDVSQYDSVFTKEDIEKFASIFNDTHNSSLYESFSSSKILKNWESINAPLEVQVEAYNLITAILEAKDYDDDDEDDDFDFDDDEDEEDNKNSKESDKTATDKIRSQLPGSNNNKNNNESKDKDSNDKKSKNPLKGIKLNDLKLYAKGIKAKFKDMTSKEKEWCHNVDMEFSRLYKSITDAATNDRRESIIKGSVIPSFSKCVKFAIVLAGMGVAFQNPLIPALTAIAGLAMSKRLTKKEKLLLLDEIEVELEVVDREIQSAEAQDATKKLRKLLMYKKELQRQYQRIRYNIRIGKDILPSSTTGLNSSG